MRFFKQILPFIFLLALGLIVYWPTLKLDIFGDSWLVFWNGKQNFGTVWPWHKWTTYFNPYGFIHFSMHIYRLIGGYNAAGLYAVSFIFRLIATLTFYIFLRHRSFKRLPSIISAALFLVTPIGLETTDWVFQFASYISITFFFMCIDLLLNLNTTKKVIGFILAFFLTIVINPIRGHGILISVLALMVVQIALLGGRARRYLTTALVLTVGLFVVLGRLQTFGDTKATYESLIKPGLTMLTTSLAKGDYQHIPTLMANIGNEFFPDWLLVQVLDFDITQKLLLSHKPGVEAALVSVTFCGVLAVSRKRKSAIWIFILQIAVGYLVNKNLFYEVAPVLRLSAVLGVEALIFMIFNLVFDLFPLNKRLLFLDVFIFCVAVGFLLIPWIHDPRNVLYSVNRYLIYSAFILPLFVGQMIESGWPRVAKFVSASLIAMIFLTITNYEISQMNFRHGLDYSQTVWKNLDPYIRDLDYSNQQYVFYFTGDSPARLHDSMVYVFSFRAGLLYNINKLDNLPMPIDNLADFKSLLTDGAASRRYLGRDTIFPFANARAFEIIGDRVMPLNVEKLISEKAP